MDELTRKYIDALVEANNAFVAMVKEGMNQSADDAIAVQEWLDARADQDYALIEILRSAR